MTYTTQRLLLRPMTLDDAGALFGYRSLPEVNTYTYTPTWTSMADAVAHVEKYVPMLANQEHGFGKWMIVRQDTGAVIGDVFLNKHSELQGTTEMGYMLHPDHQGQGFATEAVAVALRIGFEEWGVHRIYARVDEDNTGSARVCQKLGMRQEARLIESDRRGDVWSTELVFAMLDREWNRQQHPEEIHWLPAEDYYHSLPRRYMGAGVLITDADDRVLLVETTYKTQFEIPGGVCDAGESPSVTAAREIREELGIDLPVGSLLVLDHRTQPPPKGDAMMFVYDGGVITSPELLKPDEVEIKQVHFVSIDGLDGLVTDRMAARIRSALRARDKNKVIEIFTTDSPDHP